MANIFGGGNENSLYVPMSPDEQEVLERIQSQHDMIVKIKGWGTCRPIVQFGDARVALYMELNFDRPQIPVPTSYFDLELWNGGDLLLKGRHSLTYNNQPMMIGAGVQFFTVWDIAIHHMDPAWVKKMKPGATGLTTKVLDPVTGKPTLAGNMRLTEDHMKVLHLIRQQEMQTRQDIAREARIATSMQKAAEDAGEIIKLDIPED